MTDQNDVPSRVVLDLGKEPLGDRDDPERVAREATALAKEWELRA